MILNEDVFMPDRQRPALANSLILKIDAPQVPAAKLFCDLALELMRGLC